MTNYKTPLALAKKLISLPSYRSKTQDETPVTDFLFSFLKETFPDMTVQRQYIKSSKRYNLILRGKASPRLFVLGHVDTVQPKNGWQTDPLKPTVRDGKLYGLGSSDMKSSLAAFLWALAQEQWNIKRDNLMFLMYVDEEYDFEGIRRFLTDEVASKFIPELTLSLDGELAVATGCRGLIEISLTTRGQSGHSSNPKNGINTITETIGALQDTSQKLAGFTDPYLGTTTTNIAYLQGGVRDSAGEWLREGNIIPDTVQAIFEVRSATSKVDAAQLQLLLAQSTLQRGLILENTAVRHDIAPWPVNYDPASLGLLQKIYTTADMPLARSDRKLQGYIDAQMVVEKIPAPTFIIGTGGNNKHGANENVPLDNINQAARIYTALLREVLA